MKPLLEIHGLTKLFGSGCAHCLPGGVSPEEGNRCGRCGTVVGCGDVSLMIHPGEVLGVVGESGSGKSTLVRLIHFELDATAGEIYLNNGKEDAAGRTSPAKPFRRQVRSRHMGLSSRTPGWACGMHGGSRGQHRREAPGGGWEERLGDPETGRLPVERTDIP
jgi:putative phosphonate transport system ATP-binding protein